MATPKDFETQIESLKGQIGEARQTLAERLAKRMVLDAELEKSNHELGLYVLSHESINEKAPSVTEAERNYALNEAAISVLRVQIHESATNAAELEQKRLDLIQSLRMREEEELRAKRRETQQKIKDAQQADTAIALAQDSLVSKLMWSQQDAATFRNGGGRAKFIATLVGEAETVYA